MLSQSGTCWAGCVATGTSSALESQVHSGPYHAEPETTRALPRPRLQHLHPAEHIVNAWGMFAEPTETSGTQLGE